MATNLNPGGLSDKARNQLGDELRNLAGAIGERAVHVVTERIGIPSLDRGDLDCDGTLGERAELNANFRDEYYALVPAVDEAVVGPALSGEDQRVLRQCRHQVAGVARSAM